MIRNRLKQLRERRGVPAAQLAKAVGVRRQTIYAIEAGDYVPNTAVSLRLAQQLDVAVEDLFRLADAPTSPQQSVSAEVLSTEPERVRPGGGVRLCGVDGVYFAIPAEPTRHDLPWVDGKIQRISHAGIAAIDVYGSLGGGEDRLLLAGCDPAVPLLAHEIELTARGAVVQVPCSSARALEWLRAGKVHVAGAHLRDPQSGEFNLPEVSRMFEPGEVVVLTFAHWEDGIVLNAGNPKNIRSIGDFARDGVRLVNREPGSGSRRLLDRLLTSSGLDAAAVDGYQRMVHGHFEAAEAIRRGDADGGVATRYTAETFGLDFLPLETERYDFIIRTSHLQLPLVKALTDALNRLSLRRKLSGLAGYDTTQMGAVVG